MMKKPQGQGALELDQSVISRLKVLGELPAAAPVLDKFLIIALLGGGIGGAVLGLSVWLMRLGFIDVLHSYLSLRHLHAQLEIHVFFGVAITGFIIQAAPRLLGISALFSRSVALGVALCPIGGMLLSMFGASSWLTGSALALGPVLTAVLLILRQKRKVFRPHSLFLLTAMVGFLVSAFSNLGDPAWALVVVWFAVGLSLLGTAHLFIVNLLGGKALGNLWLYIVYILAVTGGVLLGLQLARIGAVLCLCGLGIYATRIKLFSLNEGPLFLRLGFMLGFGWAIIALTWLAVDPLSLDQVAHLLALGWGVSILFTLSLHITAVIGGLNPKPTKLALALLLAWQFLPIVRGLLFGTTLAWFAAPVTILVLLSFWSYWLIAIAARSHAIMKRH